MFETEIDFVGTATAFETVSVEVTSPAVICGEISAILRQNPQLLFHSLPSQFAGSPVASTCEEVACD